MLYCVQIRAFIDVPFSKPDFGKDSNFVSPQLSTPDKLKELMEQIYSPRPQEKKLNSSVLIPTSPASPATCLSRLPPPPPSNRHPEGGARRGQQQCFGYEVAHARVAGGVDD